MVIFLNSLSSSSLSTTLASILLFNDNDIELENDLFGKPKIEPSNLEYSTSEDVNPSALTTSYVV